MITVSELRKVLKKLPNNMPVVLGIEESLEDICSANIEIVKIEYTDNKGEYEMLLVLPVCNCEKEDIQIENKLANPELN